jgi:Protein of unknown function (DUF1573)
MKKILLFATASMFSLAVMAQPKVEESTVKFNTEKHDFGKIKQGTPVIYYFEITNKSDQPIVVENASASCGCTIPEKPEKPILPGATAKIKVQYSAAAVGPFNKDVYIKLAGVEQPKVIHISGEVLAPETAPPAKN